MPVRRIFSELKGSNQGNLDFIALGLVLGAVLVLFVSMFTTSWMTASEDDTSFGFGLYGVEISFEEMLQPEIIKSYAKQATGEKYLVNPHKE